MTQEELSELWEFATLPFKEETQAAVFNNMYGKSNIYSLINKELKISVENSTVARFINDYSLNIINARILEHTGIVVEKVDYVIKHTNKKKKEERAAAKINQPETLNLFQESKNINQEIEPNRQLAANLNPKYTFNKFIPGNMSRLAYAAAQSVAEYPSTNYCPLYIYGGVGLGKTHLMQAIGNYIVNNNKKARVLYVSCEHFLNEFSESIRNKKVDTFKKKYRTVDVLLIDDIQFIAGKDGVQEEFFHTYNALDESNKQIVMTSDKVPSDIKGLEERLSSRFSKGMIADIQMPDQSTRQAILKSKSEEKGILFSDSILSYIANEVSTNVRELEGALTTVAGNLIGIKDPSIKDVKEALRKAQSSDKSKRRNSSDLLIEVVCKHYDIDKELITGPGRQRELVKPRMIIMYLLKHEVGMTYPMIGRELGGRDHTTIMHGVEKITKEIKKMPDLLDELQDIKDQYYEYR